jgi:hypothetical protein
MLTRLTHNLDKSVLRAFAIRHMLSVLGSLVLLGAAVCQPTYSQTTDARMVGRVTDPSGASVADVVIELRNLATNVSRSTISGATGEYLIPSVPIGSYELSAELDGFKRFTRGPLMLDVNQTIRIDVEMELGSVSEEVTVTAGAPLIETDRSTIQTVTDNRSLRELPLNARNFLRLASLVPGTTRGQPGNFRPAFQGENLTVNGARAGNNSYLIDGVDNTEMANQVATVRPSIDALESFSVQTANYSAEFGRAGGAVVNLAIKSGTNEIHGTVYEFLRNDVLDAADFFTNFFGREKTSLRRNQFGFSVGGPAIKNKSFWFGNLEWIRERRARTRGFTVPTPQMLQGDFSGSLGGRALPTLHDPFNLDAEGNRTPFADNQIPRSRFHPVSERLLDRWPSITNAGSRRNFVRNFNNPLDGVQFHVRFDHNLTDKDRLMARYSGTRTEEVPAAIDFARVQIFPHQNATFQWSRLFSPGMINEFRFGFNKFVRERVYEDAGTDFNAQLGLPSFPQFDDPFFFGHPQVAVSGLATIGGGDFGGSLREEPAFEFIDNLTFHRARHSVKTGVNFRYFLNDEFWPQNSLGSYSFDGRFTNQLGTGNNPTGFGEFLLGVPRQQAILNPEFFQAVRVRNLRIAAFVQDDYRILPNLTLNIGLRYARDGPWREVDDRWSYFDLSAGEMVYPQSLDIPFPLPFPHRFDDIQDMKVPQHQFAPRFGFAWRPFKTNATVIRSGYGIFLTQPVYNVVQNVAFTPPPFLLRTTAVSGATTPELTFGEFPDVSPDQIIPRNPSFFTADPEGFKNGYMQHWNFGIEHQVLENTAIKLSYVGTASKHLERRLIGNAALPPGPGPIQPRRLYPEFGRIIWQESSAASTYHSLQVQAERRFSRGLFFLFAYTYSKALDENSDWSGDSSSSRYVQDPRNARLEKGRAAFDLRHRMTMTFVYSLPFRSENKALDFALGGWQLSGIITSQTGFPFAVNPGGDPANADTLSARADLVGNPKLPGSQRSIDRWFNTEAFVVPAPFTFGNSGRNIVDGPKLNEFEASIAKSFFFKERYRLQFRGEFFNAFNHPAFGFPSRTVTSLRYGTIRSGGQGREIQLGLKFIF